MNKGKFGCFLAWMLTVSTLFSNVAFADTVDTVDVIDVSSDSNVVE